MYRRIATGLLQFAPAFARPRAATLAALLVALPGLATGFFFDDYLHLLTLRGEGIGATPFDLFLFAQGDAGEATPLIESGPWPWYAPPDLKIHFLRPLASATMVLDHRVFGEFAPLYHLHSALWYALLVWAALLVYRRALPPAAAGLAVLLYVLDEGHLLPVLWWSNRNALVSAAPALLGLAAHLRWREAGWKPGLPLSLLGYATGLAAGETAVGIFGYLGAYELLRREPVKRRLGALAPAGCVAATYVVVYKLGNYGVAHSGVYFDPIGEWREYLAAAPGRFVDLAAAQLLGLPVELPVFAPAAMPALRVATAVGLLALAAAARPLWRGLDVDQRRNLAWLGLGAVLAALPALATFPSGRLLTISSLGACAVVGGLLVAAFQAGARMGPLTRSVALGMTLFHVLLMPWAWVGAGLGIPAAMTLAQPAFEEIELDPTLLPGQRVVVLFSADPYTGFYPDFLRRYRREPMPRYWKTLSLAPVTHEVTRRGPDTFELKTVNGEMLATPFERLMRSHTRPLRPGDTVRCDGFVVTVLDTGTWGPTRIGLKFDAPLDDPRWLFLAWRDGKLGRFQWPDTGESIRLDPRESYFAWPHFKTRLGLR